MISALAGLPRGAARRCRPRWSALPPAAQPGALNAALVRAPAVVPSASMHAVLRKREGEAECLDALLLGLIFFPFSCFVLPSLNAGEVLGVPEVSRGNWGKGCTARTEGCSQLLLCYTLED